MADPAPPPGFTLDNTPPPPPGYSLDSGGIPAPPKGFTMDGAGPPPQSKMSNIFSGLAGAYKESLYGGLLMQPVRAVMEGMGVGMDQLKAKYPGQTDDWYKSHLHNIYNTAITNLRQGADQEVSQNPYPGHQVGNFVANVVGGADPTYLVAPGLSLERGALEGGIKAAAPKVAKYVAKSGAVMAGIGSASDAAAQLMDMAEGQQKNFDVQRNLTSAAATGAFGVAHAGVATVGAHPAVQGAIQNAPVSDFVKNLFMARGVDTTPPDTPEGRTSALTGQRMEFTPEEKTQLQGLLRTGSVDDIKQFFQGKNGPQPTWAQVNQLVEMRNGGRQAMPLPDRARTTQDQRDMFQQAVDQSVKENHAQLVSDHVDALTKDWKNRPDVEVIHDVNDIQDLQIKQEAIKDGVTPDNTVGWVGSDGKVRIMAGQVKTPEAVNAVLYHEALGHYGLAQRFGTGLDNVLNTLYSKNIGQFRKAVDDWKERNPGAYGGDTTRAAEEVLAEQSQNGPLKKSWGDAVVSHIRRFGRQMGLKLSYSDAEVNHILAMAHDAVINGKSSAAANGFRMSRDVPGGDGQWMDTGNRMMYVGQNSNVIGNKPSLTDRLVGRDGSHLGWFTGPDGQRRFEISDHRAELKNWDNLEPGTSLDFTGKNPKYRLEDVLDHPTLYKAYPELKDLTVTKNPAFMDFWGSTQGWFDPKEGVLNVAPKATDPRSTMLHELQHWIQHREGFSFGASPGSVKLLDKGNLNKLEAFYKRKLAENPVPEDTRSNAARAAGWDIAEGQSHIIQDKLDRVHDLQDDSHELVTAYADAKALEIKQKVIQTQIKRIMDKFDDKYEQDKAAYDKHKADFDQKIADLRANLSELRKAGRYNDEIKVMNQLTDAYREERDTKPPYPRIDYEARRAAINPLKDREAELGKQHDEALKNVKEIKGKYSDLAYDMYRLVAGEREARDVQSRQYMHPKERAAMPPYSHEDILDNELIHNGSDVDSAASSHDDQEPEPNRFMTPQQLNRSIADGTYQVQAMEQAYNATDRDYVPTTRTWAEVRQDALKSGFSPSAIKNMGDIDDISKRLFRIQAAAKVLDSRIAPLLDKVDTPAWSDGDKDQLRQALVDHAYILNKLRNERAETARALNLSKAGYTRAQMETYGEILRESGGSMSPLGDDDTLNRFAKALKQLKDNPDGLNAMVDGLSKPHWEDYLTTLHQNMMLSGLSTHVKAPLDMMIGIGRELLDNAGALPFGAAREALRTLGVDLKPGVHPTETAARLWGVIRAGLDANTYRNTAKVFIEGGYNPNGFGGKQNARIPVVSKVTDLISAQDAFFRAFATNMHLYGLGTRQALDEARLNSTPKDWDTIMTQGSSYARNPTPDMLKEARALADHTLLLNRNALTEPLDKLKRTTEDSSALRRIGAFVANFITPFVRVESNSLMNRVIRRSPLAFLDPQTIKDLKAGGPAADTAMSRIVLGTAAIASYWAAAGQKNSKLTGEGPDNPAKRAVLEATGYRPNAVHEDGQYNTGNKLGISFNPFDLHNATASMVASLRQSYDKGANQGQVATGIKLAVLSSLKSLTSMSYINDIAPAIDALTAPSHSASDKMAMFLGDQAATMTPNLFGSAARVFDQGQPMTLEPGNMHKTILNSVEADIPGLREQLPKRIDPLGGEFQSGASLFGQHTWFPQTGNHIVAGNHVDETNDPAKREIGRLSQMFDENIVSPVQRTVQINGEKIKLNNQQLSDYQRMVGHEIVENVRDKMNTPEWGQMSDEEKALWIRSMQKDSKKAVKEYLYANQ